ncbi:hypothetical protein [Ponticaulis profundi]|uniref:CTP synthetase n=1 Tax=Ponticaulis profundi TaxID=2665222 RepID=A0ABW1S6Y6_9PROT
MTTKTHLSVLLFALYNAVIFGAGLLLTLALAQSSANIGIGIAASALAALIGGAILARLTAPRMRNRYWKRKDKAPKPVWS